MADFDVTWDAYTESILRQLLTTGQAMQELFDDLGEEFGDAGKEIIKRNVHGNGRWQPSTGRTADGIDYEVDRFVDGFSIQFVGTHMTDDGKHNIANMIDVGNFPENTELWAAGPGNGLGFKAFPISGRSGDVWALLTVIHGMGHTDKSFPRFFSDNAVYELRDRTALLAEGPLQKFLDSLV